MSKPRFSLRRNGTKRMVMRIEYHVPEDMVEWLRTYTSHKSEADAIAFIRKNVEDLMGEYRTLIATDDEYAMVGHFDSTSDLDESAYEIYEGPRIVRLN